MQQVDETKLFKYSKREDNFNVISHALGAVLSIIGMVALLIAKELNGALKIGVIIYGLSMFALFSASSLYHHQQDPKRRAVLKRMDHAMILVMISGTYAPFCLAMNSKISILILIMVYILSVIGILLKVIFINVSSKVSITIYLVVGWLAIFMMKDIVTYFDPIVIILMVAGGVVYSLGALVYAFTSFEYHHALWHVFVLVAAVMFYFAVAFAI